MRTVKGNGGLTMPVLGQGTWMMGQDRRARDAEARALRLGLDLGMTLLDTAEMYADGGSEEVVGEAIAGRRDGVFLVSKVLPQNASRPGTIRAAERSLRRMGTDRMDLYLLHWPGSHPLEETLEAFVRLREGGKILHYGVSNFDTVETGRAMDLPGGPGIAANQVFYNLARRGIERNLIPWCAKRGVVVMAYSPLDQGALVRARRLREVAARHDATPAQIAIAWAIRAPGVVAIPKSSSERHVRENAVAARIRLTRDDLEALDGAWPAPTADVPLETC